MKTHIKRPYNIPEEWRAVVSTLKFSDRVEVAVFWKNIIRIYNFNGDTIYLSNTKILENDVIWGAYWSE